MATDRKTLLRTDRTLVPLFLLTVWSGMELHAAGHSARPEAIGIWSAAHITASAASWLHRSSTSSTTGNGIRHLRRNRRSEQNDPPALGLLPCCGTLGCRHTLRRRAGLFHYKTGLLLVPVGLLHLLKRLRILTRQGSGKRVRHFPGRDRFNGHAGPGLR